MDASISASTLEGLGASHVVVTTYPVVSNCYKSFVTSNLQEMTLTQLLRFAMVMQRSTAEARGMPEAEARRSLIAVLQASVCLLLFCAPFVCASFFRA